MINPENAKQKGIENGDLVVVSSKRGKILCGAVVKDDVRKDVVCVAEGEWHDPQNPGEIGSMYVHGDVNVLTIDKGTSKLTQGNISHIALVNIEKFTGNAPKVKVFSKPNA
ncbi:molybdopterin dinucleotide binding domain-containing protein [Campylobacter concisus]|uniref:molybdopterin dinucleotide binding domain-containing protein n=1 Tax=Campylobacter concisus TaxID=199 RepID=UPI00122CE724|nr:molybdopterin dinucleotide binding domain-containing protein [Campylobacter concisus]